MSDLDGRVVAIAGASGGLGPSVAKRLAAGGATIAGVDRSEELLESLRAHDRRASRARLTDLRPSSA